MRNKLQINIITDYTADEFKTLLQRTLPLLKEDLQTITIEQKGIEDLKDTHQPSRKYEVPRCSFKIK